VIEDELDLIERCLTGDRQAFHDVTLRYYRPVCGFLLRRLDQPDLVEDLAQETFLEALRNFQSGVRPRQLSSWLFGIAHNRCGQWLRRRRPRLFSPTEPPVDVTAPSDIEAAVELEAQQHLLETVRRNVAELSADVQRLLELKHKDGKTCEQIAQQLGRPVGTVKSLLARTYKALREKMPS
jgi:RNA polymerase sigma-70 factor (ECF subfamily)